MKSAKSRPDHADTVDSADTSVMAPTPKHSTVPVVEYALFVVLAVLWGGAFSLIKVALGSYPPATIVSTRILMGAVVLLGIAVIRKDVFPSSAARWGALLIQGLLQSGMPFLLITWAERYVASSVAGIITSTPPMFVFLITVFLIRTDRFDGIKLVGIVLGMSGVALIAVTRSETFSSNSTLAVFAVLAASCSYGTGAVFGRRFAKQSAFVTAGVSLLLAACVTAPVALVFEQPWTLSPAVGPTLALLTLGLFSTALASVIFFRLIKTLGALVTASHAYLLALFSVALGAMFLGETLGLAFVIATVLILGGVFLVSGHFRRLVLKRQIQNHKQQDDQVQDG